MDAFVSDFLYAFRIFFKRPGLTLLAILALAVSLGMSTTTFSSLNGMFLKPLPFKDADRLFHIYLENVRSDLKMMPLPFDQLESLQGLDSFEDVIGYYSGTINISGDGRPARYTGAFVSPGFLKLLGHQPLLGRSFSKSTSAAEEPREMLISEELWSERYREDPDVLGQTVRANGATYTIVGVLPRGFHFPNNALVWVPLNPTVYPGKQEKAMHVIAVGRLNDAVTPQQANAELAQVYKTWKDDSASDKAGLALVTEPFGRLEMNFVTRSMLIVTIGAVIFVLLVSCANVANLLVGRALTRGREMAIRSALGASRRRIMRQLLTESLVLSFFGGIGGLLYAAWAIDVTINSHLLNLPYWMNIELDWRVFLFVLSIIVGTALVSGLVPAWQASKTDLNEMLKDTSHTSSSFRLGRLTRLLAVIQIAFSCALLFGAGLVTRNTLEMSRIEPGYDPDTRLTMRMGLFPQDYPEESMRDDFYRELTSAVSDVPGVKESAVTSWLAEYGNYEEPFVIPKSADAEPEWSYAYIESVSENYFSTMGMKTIGGRTFLDADTAESSRVVVVNEAFAKRYFPDQKPIGQSVRLFLNKEDWTREAPDTWQIVGIVSDVRVSNFIKPKKEEAMIYLPYTQVDSAFMTLIVETNNSDMTEIQNNIQMAILNLDPHLPVYFIKTMKTYISEQIQPYRILANFFLSVGLMALFLAAIGVYGMLAFNVSRRRREIGIRMALGATTRKIISQVLRQGFYQVVVGIGIGTGLAYLVGQLTRNFLLGVNPMDPSVYLGVLLILVGVAVLAFFVPARRAARLSPMEALRYE